MYRIVVEDVGLVYEGENYAKASMLFGHYQEMSEYNMGLLAGLSVVCLKDKEIVWEFGGEKLVKSEYGYISEYL